MNTELQQYIEELKGQGVVIKELPKIPGYFYTEDNSPFKWHNLAHRGGIGFYFWFFEEDNVVYPDQFQAFQAELTQVITICETLNRLLQK